MHLGLYLDSVLIKLYMVINYAIGYVELEFVLRLCPEFVHDAVTYFHLGRLYK